MQGRDPQDCGEKPDHRPKKARRKEPRRAAEFHPFRIMVGVFWKRVFYVEKRGADASYSMQWQTKAEAKAKDRWE